MSRHITTRWRLATVGVVIAASGLFVQAAGNAEKKVTGAATDAASSRAVLDQYCLGCHNAKLKTAGLAFDALDVDRVGADAETWERVVKKLRGRAMPPLGSRRPDPATYQTLITGLEDALDRAAQAAPDPGRLPVHRLNRLQYSNAIRDLFGLEIDGKALLPADDTGYGFDNIGDVLTVSPGLLDSYLLAAIKISRLAVGDDTVRPQQTTYDVPYLALGQDDQMGPDQPLGSRGGIAIRHYFPLDGEYSLKVTLQRSDLAASAAIRGITSANLIDLRLDRERLKLFTLGGSDTKQPEYRLGYGSASDDDGLEVRFRASAGVHLVGVSFNKDAWDVEGVGVSRLPLTSAVFSRGQNTSPLYGRIDMGLDRIDITGPFGGRPSAGSLVRRNVFVCRPVRPADEDACARRILGRLARRAYRRPITESELGTLIGFYKAAREGGTFDAGVESALTRMLVDLNFLFLIERDPEGVARGSAYRLSDLELASRLSFFLWSSIPDDELLDLAAQNRLREPRILERQVRRMLTDARADAFIDSFFGQWLTVRNIAAARPDAKVFPDFDDSLRQAFQQETTLFLQSQVREDRPALELLTANYTFANERLARHYGLSGVLGSQFRRVALPDDSRAGLLGQGSVLTVTSYADRTSVVVRGKWILETLLGIPPPPPPENVPPLTQTDIKGSLRQRMEHHRRNPFCASCHSTIDPLGFALENFDGVGKFRSHDGGAPVDASGVLADGTAFKGPSTFRQALVDRQDAFLSTLVERLMTYALGRGVEAYDMPVVRSVLRAAAPADYRWSALVLAIVKSTPFQSRRAES